ncbi:MAG TPA: CoA transferase [Caulobacteraceae bacterium]|nr:CoA transferase [Caulobacteraceae bacterium]
MTLPLDGVRVLELGSVLMTPYASQWLADLGADVVKVEPPAGDTTRRTGPQSEPGMAAMFLGSNRNKRSIVLDLKSADGREALLALVESADILVHNNRPQKMEALGLSPDALLARNPRLVYACMHGFRADGPYGGRPAYDDVIQGLCGLVDLMGQRLGAPDYLPTTAADKTVGLVGVVAILAALSRRDRTGRGGYVEVPMFESMVAFTAVEHLYGHQFDPPKGPASYPRVMAPDRRPQATADGYICALPYNDMHWRRLFEAVGRPELTQDPRFVDIAARTANVAELYALLASILKTRTTAEWLDLLERLEIPCAEVKSLADLTHDPHLMATGFFEKVDLGGQVLRLPGVPVLFDGERPPVRRPPRLGEHTREVLEEAGVAPARIEAVLGAGPASAREPEA